MKIVPSLAKSYEVVNPTTVVLRLREDVKFHNGEPFNAQVVKFSLERVLDPKTKSPRITSLQWLKSVEIVDEYTVRLNFKYPYPIWQEELQNLAMVPPKYIKEKGDEYFAEHPVGTGPYKFVKWVRGQEIVMTANEEYFKGAPHIKKVIFKIIPDPSTRFAALLAGKIDLLRNISPEEIPILEANKNIKVYTVPILRFGWIYFYDALNPDSPFYDKRVRQALNYAVNIPEIIKEVIYGLGTPTVVLNPLHFGYDPEVKPYPYDPAKAKELLSEAGFPNGFSFTCHYTTANAIKVDEVMQAIQSQLAKVGVKMKLQKWSPVGYMELIDGGRARPAFYLNWGSFGVFDGDAILFPFFRSGQRYAFFHTPELDKLIDQERVEMNPEKRKQLMSKIQRILREEAPWIFNYAFHTTVAANAKLDYKPRSDEMYYAYEIGLKE
ncbi:MAG: ABC transporter substrate-binding protein [Deltaproteobacteria bacterium]|nr:MAG: ABC transporter substrate-binding protein [Deltaproteobacteria bacterium]